METEVKGLARPKDLKLVEKAAESARRQYVAISGRDVLITVDGELSDTM